MLLSYKFIKPSLSFLGFCAASILLIGQPANGQNQNFNANEFRSRGTRLAQLPQDRFNNNRIRRLDNNSVTGTGGGGSMSNRFRKYMKNDTEGQSSGNNNRRQRFRQRFGNMSQEDKAALRQRLQSMSPDERRQFMRNMRQKRGGGGGGMRDAGRGRSNSMGRARGNRHVRNHSRRSKKKGMRGGRSWFNRKPLDLGPLGLSDKQKSRIMTFRQANSVKARAVNKKLRAQRSRMKRMMFDPTATRDDIMNQRNQLRSLQNQAEDIMISDFLSIREVLSKEQLQMLPEIAPGRRRSAKRKAPPKVAPAIGQEAKGSGI